MIGRLICLVRGHRDWTAWLGLTRTVTDRVGVSRLHWSTNATLEEARYCRACWTFQFRRVTP